MNLETEVKYQVYTKAVTIDEWFPIGSSSLDLELARDRLERAKKLTGTNCRLLKLTTTKEIVE